MYEEFLDSWCRTATSRRRIRSKRSVCLWVDGRRACRTAFRRELLERLALSTSHASTIRHVSLPAAFAPLAHVGAPKALRQAAVARLRDLERVSVLLLELDPWDLATPLALHLEHLIDHRSSNFRVTILFCAGDAAARAGEAAASPIGPEGLVRILARFRRQGGMVTAGAWGASIGKHRTDHGRQAARRPPVSLSRWPPHVAADDGEGEET